MSVVHLWGTAAARVCMCEMSLSPFHIIAAHGFAAQMQGARGGAASHCTAWPCRHCQRRGHRGGAATFGTRCIRAPQSHPSITTATTTEAAAASAACRAAAYVGAHAAGCAIGPWPLHAAPAHGCVMCARGSQPLRCIASPQPPCMSLWYWQHVAEKWQVMADPRRCCYKLACVLHIVCFVRGMRRLDRSASAVQQRQH